MLTEFFQENALFIANTLYQQHKLWLYSWTSPDGQHLNQIDSILFSRRWRSSIQSAKQDWALTVAQIINTLLPNSDWNWRKWRKPLDHSISSVQFSSVAQSCPTLCNPMNHRTPGLPVHHQLPEFTQPHVHWVRDAIQPSHPLSSPSPPAHNPSQNQSLFQWVNSSHEVAKVLEFQLQHQSFQWTHRADLL